MLGGRRLRGCVALVAGAVGLSAAAGPAGAKSVSLTLNVSGSSAVDLVPIQWGCDSAGERPVSGHWTQVLHGRPLRVRVDRAPTTSLGRYGRFRFYPLAGSVDQTATDTWNPTCPPGGDSPQQSCSSAGTAQVDSRTTRIRISQTRGSNGFTYFWPGDPTGSPQEHFPLLLSHCHPSAFSAIDQQAGGYLEPFKRVRTSTLFAKRSGRIDISYGGSTNYQHPTAEPGDLTASYVLHIDWHR